MTENRLCLRAKERLIPVCTCERSQFYIPDIIISERDLRRGEIQEVSKKYKSTLKPPTDYGQALR